MSLSVAPVGPLRGEVVVPGDKSVSHRAFLITALCSGSARVEGVLGSEDVAASRRLVEAIGCRVEREGEAYIVRPGPLQEPGDVIDCGNSGTTLRLGAGVVSHAPGLAVLTGDGSLRGRPMRRIADPLAELGVRIDGRQDGRFAPLIVHGPADRTASLDLSLASAQVKSAALLAGKRAGVRVREPRRSRDHTERMLAAMGASLSTSDDGWLTLEPGPWSAVDIVVPGDLSSAAFWLVAGAIVPGSCITLPGVGMNPTRAGVVRALQAMGADLTVSDEVEGVEPLATLTVREGGLRGTEIAGDLALECLDELPVLAVAAALAKGTTTIRDAAELRVKESDRIARVVEGLTALGIEVEERPDGMVIEGGTFGGSPVTIDAEGDHRLAMAFTVAALRHGPGIELLHADSVRTSYPTFFEDLATLTENR